MENQTYTGRNQAAVSIGNWIITLILICVPVINIVMMIIWAFSSRTPVSKSNFAKAALIIWVVGTILLWIFWGSISAMMMRNGYYPPM